MPSLFCVSFSICFFLKLIVACGLCVFYGREDNDSNVWLHGLYGLHGLLCPLSPKRPLKLITHSLIHDPTDYIRMSSTPIILGFITWEWFTVRQHWFGQCPDAMITKQNTWINGGRGQLPIASDPDHLHQRYCDSLTACGRPLDGSNKLDLEWIRPVDDNFWRPRFQKPLLRPWVHPCNTHRQIILTLHIYMPKQFQWTWFGVNPPGDCWFFGVRKTEGALVTPMGMGPNDHNVAQLQANWFKWT